MTTRRRATGALLALLAASLACSGGRDGGGGSMTPARHAAFPIVAGEHSVDCAACHTNPATFREFSCTSCHTHAQAPCDLGHKAVAGYTFSSGASCYACHSAPVPAAFSHTAVAGQCATCHAAGAAFAVLPRAGFTHMAIGAADCGSCHMTSGWTSAGATPPALASDPAQDVTVTGLVPSYAGTSIVRLAPVPQTLPMAMNHATAALDAATLANCAACHANSTSGDYFPGSLHSSLANEGLQQPTTCADCHAAAAPAGFVGPNATRPARTPPSGEMKHDAVAWANGAPSAAPLVTADCGACHASPSGGLAATWSTGAGGGAPAYHAALGAAQPASCVDCHANSRPAALTAPTASLPAGVSFDHAAAGATGDCAACHAGPSRFTAWSGGRFHAAGDANPATCLPCHAGERPTSTATWASTSFAASPFDYGTNAAGVTHGDGLDCAACHAGPGTGAWGGTQSWVGGRFDHGASSVAASTCIACHASQRPDLLPGATAAGMKALLGFDHAADGAGDCLACHQATVAAGRYVDLLDPVTKTLPNGDWKGAFFWPGATLASAGDQFISVTQLTLQRTGALVTGATSTTATLFNGLSHTSPTIPAAMSPGTAATPDATTCWHCHVNTNGTVTSYANGRFHAALGSFSATPGGAVSPFPQPAARCGDCHAQMRPAGIVQQAGSDLVPMDHAATFRARVTLGGASAAGVADLDCSQCHKSAGGTWADGVFHASIATAVPADCTVCHYPLMADAPRADLGSGTRFTMSHRSAAVTAQRCDACHTTALARGTATPIASTLWQGGAFHPNVAAQPAACLDCHASAAPAAATQSSVIYVLAAGGTTTNAAQWMNHGAAGVVGLDCARCHAADARSAGAAWAKATPYHAAVGSAGTCQSCHGLSNGNGSVAGNGNNLPAGLTDAAMITTAASDAATGVPAGTHDQITHADANVTGLDCSGCHAQAGPSTLAGVQGKEWAQAAFHVNFTASRPLVMNGTTGRCSNCHLNVKPGASFTAFDHAAFTNAAGSQDCSACHAWPGTGTATAPNWLGGGGAPAVIFVGGFTVPSPPATAATTQGGIANLPHPATTATTTCATCHTGGAGGKQAKGYDHASTLGATHCNACHEAGSNLVGTPWNRATTQAAGAGDTRPFTIGTLRATRGAASCNVTTPNHFYPVDCSQCHGAPAGTGATTTGTGYTNAWTFPHTNARMSNPTTCRMCHTGTACPT